MNNIKHSFKDAMYERDAEQRQREHDPPLNTLDDLRGLSPEDVNRRWPEVSALLELGPQQDDDEETE